MFPKSKFAFVRLLVEVARFSRYVNCDLDRIRLLEFDTECRSVCGAFTTNAVNTISFRNFHFNLSKARQTPLPHQTATGPEPTCANLVRPYWIHCAKHSPVCESKAKKGSAEKKTDDVESFVYRNGEGELCIPGEYIRGAIVAAAKFQQDPRSPRKSAADLFKAAIISLTPLASLGAKEWDYLDKRRVCIQRNAITRQRPAMKEGWKATFILMVNLPEYIESSLLNSTIQAAGKLIGLADFRPSFGRFNVVGFEVLED
jgi:hypothetical protein